MTLNDWFIKNAQVPLRILSLFVVSIYIFFVFYALKTNEENQYNTLRDLTKTSLVIAVQQNNRELVESTISKAINVIGAKEAYYCEKNEAILSSSDIKDCSQIKAKNFNEKLISFDLSGFANFKAYFIVTKYNIGGTYIWVLISTFLVLLASAWIIFNLNKKFSKDILLPLADNLLNDDKSQILEFNQIKEKIKVANQALQKEAYETALSESRKAFSHNVRSPLRNLKLLRERFKNSFDKDDQELFDGAINQISGMAEKLTVTKNVTKEVQNKISLVSVDDCIQEAVKKKLHEKNLLANQIVFKPAISVSQLTSPIDANEFSSILSNLLNNSLEADATQIAFEVLNEDEFIKINIIDNGRGIPQERKDSVFKDGVTFGKINGSGFGLYHAQKFLQSWNGSIELISSEPGKTIFQISIPKWSVDKASIKPDKSLVILEDQIIEIDRVKKYFTSQGFRNSIYAFDSSESFLSWYKNLRDKDSFVLIADYDLGQNQTNGIEVINSLKLQKSSFLFTDSHDDENIFSRCQQLDIRLLPKCSLEQLSLI